MDLTPFLALIPAKYAVYVPAAIGIAAAIAMAVPAPKPTSSKLYVFAYKTLNSLGANAFHAKNDTAPKA
jgi:hypothetical protein